MIVNIFIGMGYVEYEIYPLLKTTIMKRGDEYITITDSIWKEGKHEFV